VLGMPATTPNVARHPLSAPHRAVAGAKDRSPSLRACLQSTTRLGTWSQQGTPFTANADRSQPGKKKHNSIVSTSRGMHQFGRAHRASATHLHSSSTKLSSVVPARPCRLSTTPVSGGPPRMV